MLGPWAKEDYDAGANHGGHAPRNPPVAPCVGKTSSTCAAAGSTNGYGIQAPFGSSSSRFSPSMSMAHHVLNHKPIFSAPATSRSRPNGKWVPHALQEEKEEKASAAVGAQESKSACRQQPDERGMSSARRKPATRPRSAKEDQRVSRQLRAEITAIREQKLQDLRQGSCTQSLQPAPKQVVRLDELHSGGTVRLTRYGHCENENAPPEREISCEYASLLEFVAGESRRR